MVGWSVPGVVPLREVREDAVGQRVLARHRITRKSLAITYLSGELLADSEFRTRFARDFGHWARVRETRVARVHRCCKSRDGVAIIGDHLIGTSLRALLVAQGALSTEAALVVFQDALRALAACHRVGLAHGDIKPEGVILTPAGQVRLGDFGLWTSDTRRLLARSTPFYLAPEQWDGPPATPAGDVYAATVMFFECLAGAPPFYAESEADLSAKHAQGAPPLDVVPQPVRQLVLRGLDKDPRRRPEAQSLLARLGEVAAQAAGSDWQRRGRRELRALLAGDSALPEVPGSLRRHLRSRPRAGSPHPKPVRLAAVMGGALALAVGLASPPLAAVIVPGASIFGSSGKSPVLAFPEPDRGPVSVDTGPVRVAPHGQRATRARPRAAKTRTARPVATAHPQAHSIPMPSIPMPDTQSAPDEHATPAELRADSLRQSLADQRTPVPSACIPRLLSVDKTCAAPHLELPPPVSTGSPVDPPRVLIPVSMPVQLQVRVPVSLPVRVEVPVPILESISIGPKTQPEATQPDGYAHPAKDVPLPTDQQGWARHDGGRQDWGKKARGTGPLAY